MSKYNICNNWYKYVLVVTLSTQVDVRLLLQLKSDLKRAINCNKFKSKVTT